MTDSIKRFNDFNLHPDLLKAIDELGYTQCTPIQERCLPLLLKGQDIAGLAQTGTGKTAAYLLPLIDRVLRSMKPDDTVDAALEDRPFKDWKNNNFILILVPTRELVTQVLESLQQLTKHTPITSLFLYGGVGYDEQKDALKKPFQFIVATPGRLIDLYKEGFVDFKQVRGVVFDEADRMFDMGFQEDVFFILRRIPQDRQLLLFSATLNFQVTEMAYEANSNPVEIDVSRDKVTTENIDDHIIHVRKEEKPKYLLSILKKYNPNQVIIFSNFKNKVPRIAQFLNDNNYPSLGISSLMTQSQRNRVIENFKAENRHNIMVATDLAARGLDIKGVDLVINYELPEDAENYVHRIGRTGRAEAKGNAVSFVSDKDVEALVRIEDYLKEKLETLWVEDTDIVADFKPMAADDFRKTSFDNKRGPTGRPDRPRRDGPRRDGGGSNGGPRRDGPRRDRDNRDFSRRDGPKRDRPPQGAEAANSMEASAPGTGGVHRDRRMGRHANSQRPERNNNSNGGGRGGRPDRPQQNGGRRHPHKKDGGPQHKRYDQSRRSGGPSSRPTPAAPKSLWGKLTTSVKKIFAK